MKKQVFLISAALATLLIANSVNAVGQHWLDGAPVQFFNDEDWELLRTSMSHTLDNAPDGTTAEWKNPETGHAGSITVIDTNEVNGNQCRKTKFFNSAGGVTGSNVYRLCKVEDGTWKLSP